MRSFGVVKAVILFDDMAFLIFRGIMASSSSVSKKRKRSEYMKSYRAWKKDSENSDNVLELQNPVEKCDLSSSDDASLLEQDCDEQEIEMHSDDTSDYTSDSSSSIDQTTVSEEQQERTKQFLKEWALEKNPPVATLNQLLTHLNTFMPNIPKCGTTLKKSCGKIDVTMVGGGEYYYLTVKDAIDCYMRDYPNSTSVNLIVNIDGVQAYKSRKHSFWPISTSINGSAPYLICLWYGIGKPNDVSQFLQQFIEEMSILLDDGYRNTSVDLSAFMCDAPAREFLKCIKGHSGYCACERCTVEGIYDTKGVRLLDTTAPLRTDKLFAQHFYNEHHADDHQKAVLSPLVALNFPMVTGFALDAMHLVYLGVVRKLLMYWKKNLSSTVVDELSNSLQHIAPYIPSLFQRRCRSFDELEKWKATEYRLFLLYLGPVVLKDAIPTAEYNLFMLLSVAMNILSSQSLCRQTKMILFAKDLLCQFVADTINVFGHSFVTYNTHSLIHLADDVLKFGQALNEFTSFPFENFLGHMIRDVRGSKYPVQQIVRRQREKQGLPLKNREITTLPHFKHFPPKNDRVFFIGHNKFAIVYSVINENDIECQIVHGSVHDYYSHPVPSMELNYCFRTTLTHLPTKLLKAKELIKTAMMIPVKDDGYIFTPLIHCI